MPVYSKVVLVLIHQTWAKSCDPLVFLKVEVILAEDVLCTAMFFG